MSKKLNLLYIFACVGICILPLIFLIVKDINGKEPDNKVESAEEFKGDYFKTLVNWFDESYGMKEEMVSLNSRITADVFGVSSVDAITVGKNGWLYASATNESYQGKDNLTKRETFNIAHNVKVLQSAVESKGAKFIFAVPANKNTLYPDNMPYYIKKIGNNTSLDDVSKELENLGVNYVNLYDRFRSQDETLYLKMDSHWNGKGAVLAYNEIMAESEIPHNTYKNAVPVMKDYEGDLAKTAFPTFTKSEENPVYETYGDIGNLNVEEPSITTTCNAGTGNLLMYRDSFGNTLIPLMSSEFSKAHYSKTKSEYYTDYKVQNDITAYKPDVVVVEIVERHLKDFTYNMPEIEAPSVKNVKTEALVTDTEINIKAKDNFYIVSGTAKSDKLNDNSEFLIELNSGGKKKTYSAYNISYVKNGNQNNYGFKAYFSSDTMPEGKVDVKVLLKNNNSCFRIAEKTENVKQKYPLISKFGVKDNYEVTASCQNVRNYEFTAVNSNNKAKVYLYNDTKEDVKELIINNKNILEKNIKKGSKVTVFIPVNEEKTYNLKIKYSDNTVHTLSNVPLYDIVSLTLNKEAKYSYITYLSVNSGNLVVTKNKELSIYQERLARQIAKRKAIEKAKKLAEQKRIEKESSIAASIAEEQAQQQAAYEAQQQAIYQQQQAAIQENTEAVQEIAPPADEGGCLSGIQLRDNVD